MAFSFHVSRITYHVSRFTFHVSRFTFHVSRITFHVSRITLPPASLTSHRALGAGTGSAAASGCSCVPSSVSLDPAIQPRHRPAVPTPPRKLEPQGRSSFSHDLPPYRPGEPPLPCNRPDRSIHIGGMGQIVLQRLEIGVTRLNEIQNKLLQRRPVKCVERLLRDLGVITAAAVPNTLSSPCPLPL